MDEPRTAERAALVLQPLPGQDAATFEATRRRVMACYDAAFRAARAEVAEPCRECGGSGVVGDIEAHETWPCGSCVARAAEVAEPGLDLGPRCRGESPDGACDDETCEAHGAATAGREPLDALREAAEDAYRVMDAATQWAAHQRPQRDDLASADEHMRGYDALLDGQVRLGQALGILSRPALDTPEPGASS